ncbi:hypothetical protein PAEH1_02640 [Paenalcaligenes hominis]|uniref:Glycoprotein n=1 Tax=Paenalcaligenes hominis TaxID=643674 RepID=A0A1U9JYA4_9BURK|nr:DUF6246 family protein [Paenalcaligenes hominis]AQS50724.1 hypothetical protein PAEH1_02640 [Paenalcaligenes hominis]
MILTEIGEIGVSVDGRMYVLRPSLYAMTQIGEPDEIVRVYSSVMSEQPHAFQFDDALAVLYACTPDDASGDVFGGYEPTKNGLKITSGILPESHVVPLAQCLMKHGITGAHEPLPRKADDEPEFVKEFDARAHVSLAIAHLGMSSEQAWQMTMTELVGALRAKFPQTDAPGANAPGIDEVEETLDWHDKVLAARAGADS